MPAKVESMVLDAGMEGDIWLPLVCVGVKGVVGLITIPKRDCRFEYGEISADFTDDVCLFCSNWEYGFGGEIW